MRTAKSKTIRMWTLVVVMVMSVGALAQGSSIVSYLETLVAADAPIGRILVSTGIVAEAKAAETADANAVLAVETWTGEAGDNNWTSNGNWAGVGGAAADDDLVFPMSPSGGLPSHNDFATNTRFRSISIQDSRYNISGNQIFLTAGISNTGTNGVASDVPDFTPNIILDANQTFSTTNKDLNLNGVVNLNGRTLNISTGTGDVNFNGFINGTGNLNVAGNATIIGDSSAFGSTEIDSGTLHVNSPGELGNVVLNGGGLEGTGTVGSITANAVNGGEINPGLNDVANPSGILTATGASVLNAATTLRINLLGTSVGTQHDQLRASGNSLNLGGANLALNVGFTPTIGQQFGIVSQTGSGDLIGQFAQGAVINSSGHIFAISYNTNAAVLTYQGNTLTWDGSSNSSWGTAANWDSNVAPLNGSTGLDLLFPGGALNPNNTNNVGGLILGSIQFTGSGYQIFGNPITLSEGISDTSSGSNSFDPDITFGASQTFSKSGAGTLTVFGDLNLGNTSRVTTDGTGNISFSGNVLGSNSSAGAVAIEKNNAGILVLAGSANNYTGQTQVNAGTLRVSNNTVLGSTQDNFRDKTIVASGASIDIIATTFQTNENFDLNGAGVSNQGAIFSNSCVSCVLNGDIFINSNTTIGTQILSQTITLNGQIVGSSTMTKTGFGTLVFNGNSTNFIGTKVVNAGQIIVNGVQQNSAVALNGATVAGSGTIGALSGSGTVSPGTSAGILSVNGAANLSSAILNIELGGLTPGTQHDRLNVTGTVNLGAGSSSLDGSFINGFVPTVGQQFTIIQATGGVTGTFSQGNTIAFGGTTFSITYNANSVVLTVVSTTTPGVEVSGRVLTSVNGRGVRGAVVRLTDTTSGLIRNVHTGNNGVYRFEDVPTGATYLVSVQSRRFIFEQRTLQVFSAVADFNLVALQ